MPDVESRVGNWTAGPNVDDLELDGQRHATTPIPNVDSSASVIEVVRTLDLLGRKHTGELRKR
jgi:hypothetical protein